MEKFWRNDKCALTYKTDLNEYHEYWYDHTKNMLNKYQFVIIESLIVPMEVGNIEVINFLKDFCRLMTIENRVVIYDNEDFVKYLEKQNSGVYFDACSNILDEILYMVGFNQITVFDHSFLYKDVYIYTESDLGLKSYSTVENYYHEEFYDE